jgi:hypothetical protein
VSLEQITTEKKHGVLHPTTRKKLKFSPMITFSRLTGSITLSPEEEDDVPALDSWIGLPSLSVDV